jgi:ABC-type multidrug transport system ATPase subunit
LALALKIAEVEILRELTGTDPLLLLDDVMSELDEKRRRLLLELIGTGTQTFITTTNLSYFDEKVLKEAQIIQLPFDGSGGVLKETAPAPKKTTRKKPATKTTATKRTAAKKPAVKPAVKTKPQTPTKTKAAPHV